MCMALKPTAIAGPIDGMSSAAVAEGVGLYAISHHTFYKHFISTLKDAPSSSFTFITGGLGAFAAICFLCYPTCPLRPVIIEDTLIFDNVGFITSSFPCVDGQRHGISQHSKQAVNVQASVTVDALLCVQHATVLPPSVPDCLSVCRRVLHEGLRHCDCRRCMPLWPVHCCKG